MCVMAARSTTQKRHFVREKSNHSLENSDSRDGFSENGGRTSRGVSEDGNESRDGSKHLRMLRFTNPGKFMEDFDPERSTREMRKMNRRIYKDSARKSQLFDETGCIIDDSRDLCDCLEEDCPGCHFPCPKCGSEKCGAECRCNRRWVYAEVEIEGANKKFHFKTEVKFMGSS